MWCGQLVGDYFATRFGCAFDASDYAALTAVVLVIGVIGYALDSVCVMLMRRFNWQLEG